MVGTINRARQALGSTLIGLVPPFRKHGRRGGTDKMKKKKYKLLAKFLTHVELETIKGFQDKLMMAFSRFKCDFCLRSKNSFL